MSKTEYRLAKPRVVCGSLLLLSVWAGLLAGHLEVATILIRKHGFDPNHLYGMSRHFVWLIPLTNLMVFILIGLMFSVLVILRFTAASWIARRCVAAFVLMPSLLVAFPRIHGLALLFVSLGVATRAVPALENRTRLVSATLRFSLPILLVLVPAFAGVIWGTDLRVVWRERSRPLPSESSPNVLLLVLDTVAADHLSLHGYARQTSPTLAELAEGSTRFNHAQSAASWTLPSHAVMFTGRWPHELSVGWLNPLDARFPTVAEHLGSQGYSTAAFIGNNLYCAADSGLGRGFTSYRDFIFPNLTALKGAALVDRSIAAIQSAESFLELLEIEELRSSVVYLEWLINGNRKSARNVNLELVDWLANGRDSRRPFFAFVNYYDAHYPYQIPPNTIHRFGVAPKDTRENALIQNWWPLDKTRLVNAEIAFVQNSYDDCVAALDEQLGCLIDQLRRGGLLDNTWLIITADHGESFGEHTGVFCHGTSLYQTELHVPLLLIPPGGSKVPLVVDESVSLRDLAATITDMTGLAGETPFPGESLLRFCKTTTPGRQPSMEKPRSEALAEVVPNDPAVNTSRDQLLEPHWPLAALADGGWSYIRREGEVQEQLFHFRDDPKERRNRLADLDARPVLERMRGKLRELTAGPLTPNRFNP